ncbi:hypothetical protein PTW35_24090 (plasmid) [Photobacterium sp. DA100]|uniref:hypothetical protein n=1 Tax=Photobacterium sp. DA100 TaxID=3027472 RepID=UPI00247B2719|nr:hypothetical protein [Photobacterium sp. DA100]WEM44361.1 hypothetical protein PTW35_24090 [Photobacterium sp. DA100]
MDSNSIKSILRLYRPGIDDETQVIKEALLRVENDPELKVWYQTYLQNEEALHQSFNDIAIPPGLKTQLTKQYAKHNAPAKRNMGLVPAAIAASLMLLVLSWLMIGPEAKPRFTHFQHDMLAFVTQPYEMDIVEDNLASIDQGFANVNWPTGYVLPASLNTLHILGGVMQQWQDEKVSIVCLENNAGKYIWLFVTTLSTFSIDKTIPIEAEVLQRAPLLTHTAWQDQHFTYYMIAEGDIDFIKSYL